MIDAGGHVQLERCAIEVIGPRPEGCRGLVAEGSGVVVKGCWLGGLDRAIQIQSYGSTVARIEQTMIVAGPELRGWAVGVNLVQRRGG